MKPSTKAHIALFLVALIYAANYTIAKEVLDNNYIQPLGFIVARVLSASIFFAIFHFLFIKEKVRRSDFGLLFLCALFGVAINQMFFFSGLKLTTPINASLIMTTTPILVLLISSILIKEKITLRKIIGVLCGATGAVLLIAYGKQVNFGTGQLLGDLMIFINAASYAVYLVLVKKLMARYHPVTVIKWVFAIGLFFVLPFGTTDFLDASWLNFPIHIYGAIAFVLICATFMTYLFNAYALKIVNPSVVSIYIYLQPLLASLIALSFGKDELSWVKICSGALIFIGVYLVSELHLSKKTLNVTN